MRHALMLGFTLLFATASVAAEPVEVAVSKRVDATPVRVLEMLADFGSWERIFEGVRVVRFERDGDRARLRQTTQRAGLTLSYTILATVDLAAGRIDVTLDPSENNDLAVLNSIWQVQAHPDGGSEIRLRVTAKSGVPMPAFVERMVVAHTARNSVDDLARSLERVAAIAALVQH